MLKYPCLVLDHDDTVVQSEATVNYPFFVEFLKEHRPGMSITLEEYISSCFHPGYVEMCRQRFAFTDDELQLEYSNWKEHIRNHVPAPFPGIQKLIHRYKAAGGIICVVSQSSEENILRDYRIHFDITPDEIFGWDLIPEHRKPNPYALYKIMEKYALTPDEILVVDDMKPAWQMARSAGVPIAFAAWSKLSIPHIMSEMADLCDFTFTAPEKLEEFLFN